MGKSFIVLPYDPPKEYKFPLVAKCITENFIVLFTGNTKGVTLTASTAWALGYISNEWTDCFDKQTWEILDEVTIKFTS